MRKSLLRAVAVSALVLSAVVVPTHAQAPASPTGLNQQVTGNLVAVSWNGVAGAAAYIVQVGTAAGASNLFNGSVGNITSAQGSLPNGTYFWRVIALGPTGAPSAPSAESQFTVGSTGPCAPPGPPQSFTSSVSSFVVSLFWAAPSIGTPPFTYIIEAGSGSGLANLAVLPTGSSATQFATSAPGGTYFIRLRAQNGCGVSGVSTEQVVNVGGSTTCTFAVSPSQLSVSPAGGTIQVNVAAPGTCRWQLTSDAFIVPTSATSGAGSATVGYNVMPTSASRTGTVTIAGIDPGPVTAQQVTVQQGGTGGGGSCGVTLNPTSLTVGPAGGEFNLGVSANPGCTWAGTPTIGFITLLLAGSQNGNGTIRYRVEPNPAQGTRTGAMRVNTPASGFQDLSITQTGSSPLTASFVLRQDNNPREGECVVLVPGTSNPAQKGPPCFLDASASSPADQIQTYEWRTIRFLQGQTDESSDYFGKTTELRLNCVGYPNGIPGGQETFSVRLTIRGLGGQTATLTRSLRLLQTDCNQ
jgi:hypothetical protein